MTNEKVTNIAARLSDYSEKNTSQIAVISPRGSMTYGELEVRSNQCALGLKRIGICKGMPTVLMVRPGLRFVVLTFALIKLGAVLIFVDPGMGWRSLGRCFQESRPRAFIGVPLAQVARIFLGWGRKTLKITVTVGKPKLSKGPSFEKLMQLGTEGSGFSPNYIDPDDPAAIVFTSGSTGPPKGVIYTNRIFVSQVELLRDQFGIKSGEINLATFPLFGLFDPALGVTTVFPKMNFTKPSQVDPFEIIKTIDRHNVTHMFGSPALIDRVGRYGEAHSVKLMSLRRVLSAGAPVSKLVLERFSQLLPQDAEIHTPYGATEALPVCSISGLELQVESGPDQGKGVCVGKPIPGVQLAVIQISDDPIERWNDELMLSCGEIGELVVWGPNVSVEYLRRPRANLLAKIRAEKGEVRHRMGDCGYIDKKGKVWFCGRKSQRVITAHGTLFTVNCEVIFNQHPQVFRSALVGIGKVLNQNPILCVELEDKKRWRGSAQLSQEILSLGARHPETREIKTLLFHYSFPVDVRHNAKIFREKLALWAENKTS